MRRDDLVPLKAVTLALGVSRTTLWRALRSDIPGMPAPRIIGRRVYFRRSDLPRLELALDGYEGRRVFETRHAKASATAHGPGASAAARPAPLSARLRPAARSRPPARTDGRQGDLFKGRRPL